MRRLVVNLDDDLDLWLQEFTNQNDIARKALRLYKGDITTDDMVNIKRSYKALHGFMKSKFEYYDEAFEKLDKLINQIESTRNWGA